MTGNTIYMYMTQLKEISLILCSACVAAGLTLATSAPVTAQDYWEYESWDNEWEQHYPTRGLEYEYEDDGDVEVEAEQYEWEAGEGYHEQEWYDPSDWFEMGRDFEVENNGYDYGYDDYGDNWTYPYYEYDYYTDDWYDNDATFSRWYYGY